MLELGTILLVAAATALSVGLGVLLTRGRGTPYLKIDLKSLPAVDEALPLITGVTESAVYEGNKAQIFQNGAVFQAMLADIASASRSVHLETFVWCEGKLEKQLVDALCDRARAGARVRVLRDAIGGSKASEAATCKLKESGVELAEYCKPRWWNIGRFNSRTHRKLLIVDGRIGYTFGHGISDEWLGDAHDTKHWRDTAIRLEGPVVHGLQTVFAQNWVEETHALPVCDDCFPKLEAAGGSAAHVVSSASGDTVSSVAMLYTIAIACARREVLIQNPYFAPNPGVCELFAMLVCRGVRVRLMVPGRHTDSPFVRRAGRYLYSKLLEAGVELYEYDRTLLHQKVVVVDEQWAHVGSTNFDARSLALNEEIGVGILDREIAQELKQAFERDLGFCRRLELEQWRRRPMPGRVFDGFAYLLHDQL